MDPLAVPYFPEGSLLHTPENQAACQQLHTLAQAQASGMILEGRTLLCTPNHDLQVKLGPFTGIIPREEAALGIREGTAREVAILSRVGKPTVCVLSAIQEDGTLLLSRRQAQARALNALLNTPIGTVLPGTVTHLAPFGAFVDIGCGVVSMIPLARCSVARISHPAKRFSIGQEIFVVVAEIDRQAKRLTLSHKELLGTWAENAARFSAGMTVTGLVRGIKPYGTFVELAPNLAGLAEWTEGLKENDRVAVYCKAIQPDRMKIKLNILQRLEEELLPPPLLYSITSGQLSHWVYSPPEWKGPTVGTVFTAFD